MACNVTTRLTYGFPTSAQAWAFARVLWTAPWSPGVSAPSAGYPSLRPENGLYTVQTIARAVDAFRVVTAAIEAGGEPLSSAP